MSSVFMRRPSISNRQARTGGKLKIVRWRIYELASKTYSVLGNAILCLMSMIIRCFARCKRTLK